MFLGKWVMGQGATHVLADAASGTLLVAAPPVDRSDRFNAEGTAEAFTLRSGLDGRYVVRAGAGYAATATSSSAANWFTLRGASPSAAADAGSDGGSGILVVDLGTDPIHPGDTVWSVSGGGVVPIGGDSPPESARFQRVVVTVGVAEILAGGLANEPDLAWVDLHGTDFGSAGGLVDLSKSDLSHANLSSTTFARGTGFQKAVATGVDLRSATAPHAILGNAVLRQAHLDGARLREVDLSYADLTGATLVGADLSNSSNLAHAVLAGAVMTDAVLVGAANVYDTSFAGATMRGVDFTGSSVTGQMDLRGADLTGATLNNPVSGVDVYPDNLVIDARTTFAGAHLQRLDLSGYDLAYIDFSAADLTGCLLDRVVLDGANLGHAVLDGAMLRGGVGLHGANLSSASLRGADLTGAQLGAVGELFRVGSEDPAYADLLRALKASDAGTVSATFAKAHHPLDAPVDVRASTFTPERAWTVRGSGVGQSFSVLLEVLGQASALTVYQPSSPAVLTNAFMVDVDLTSANLYGVRASGAQIYAAEKESVHLNKAVVEGLQANNANLGFADFSQATLTGVNFDYAVLTGANFTGATVAVDPRGGQPSFNGANLQGADFTEATVRDAILSNAAVAVANPLDSNASAGVWLFSIPKAQSAVVTPELQAACDPFTISASLLPTMGLTGPVPQGVATAFGKGGVRLSPTALLAVLTVDVYWRVDDGADGWVVFRTVDDDYRPSLGVAPGTAYTVAAAFFLPLSLVGDCGNGAVVATVRTAFAAAGHALDAGATMATSMRPDAWQVIDGQTTYTLWLSFSSSVRGVDTRITVRPALASVVSVFGASSVPLSAVAGVSPVPTGGWRISNDAEDPFSTARGYIEFTVLPTPAGGLDVYGSQIRIVRSSSPGHEEFVNVPCEMTVLPNSVLSPSRTTICPNGASVGANTASGLPYAQWFWARFLSSPPFCVPDPDGNFICPT